MVIETIATAAAQFALTHVKDKSRQAELTAVYGHAAEIVIDSFEADGHPAGTPSWNTIVNLVRNPDFSRALAFKGDPTALDFRALRSVYSQDAPSIEEVLTRMVDQINHLSLETLPTKSKTLGRVMTSLAIVQRALTENLQRELAENTDLTRSIKETVEDIRDVVTGQYSIPEGGIGPQGQPLPSDEDYRVERPEMAELSEQLESQEVAGISGVVGEGGVGKSMLAIRYARQNYLHSTIYVSLDSGDVRFSLNTIALDLGIEIPPELPDAQASARVRDALSHHQGLLLLDNAESAADTRMLLPSGGGACKTIVTLRDRSLLRTLTGVEPVLMERFTLDQARECFRKRLGQAQFDRESDAIDALCELLERLPIAVDVAAAIIHDEALPVSQWLNSFPTEKAQLDALNPEDRDGEELSADQARQYNVVWAVLLLGLKNLGDVPRRLLFAASCFDPGSGAPQQLIVPVADLSEEDQAAAPRELNRLQQRSILRVTSAPVGGDRYTMHRLMRVVVQKESGKIIKEFEERWLSAMVSVSSELMRLIGDNQYQRALLIFHQESQNLENTAKWMLENLSKPVVSDSAKPVALSLFAACIAQFAKFSWSWAVQRDLLELAVRHSEAVNVAGMEGEALMALGTFNLWDSRLSDARLNLTSALKEFAKNKNTLGEANTLLSLGELDERERFLENAQSDYNGALHLYREMSDSLGEATALKSLGDFDSREGRLFDARSSFDLALPMFRAIKNRLGEAATLESLGELDLIEDRVTDKRANFALALSIYRDLHRKHGEASALQRLAAVDSLEGVSDRAELGFLSAHKIFVEIGSQLGLRGNWGQLGDHYNRSNQPVLALKAYQASLETLSRENDERGHKMIIEGQITAFKRIKNGPGVLACLRILSEGDEGKSEEFASVMASLKENMPSDNFDAVEQVLNEDANRLRLEAIESVIAQDSQHK